MEFELLHHSKDYSGKVSPSLHKLVCFGVLVRFFCCFLFFNDASILHILAEGFSSKK